MASVKEIREQIAAKEAEAQKHAKTVSDAAKAKRQAEAEVYTLKDSLMEAMEAEFNKGKGGK